MLKKVASTLAALGCFVLLAGPASAGPRIVTPGLVFPSGGVLTCRTVNASATKTVEGTATIYSFSGSVVEGAAAFSLAPNANHELNTTDTSGRHCVVEITKGGKRNARVSLYARGSNSVADLLAAVPGQ